MARPAADADTVVVRLVVPAGCAGEDECSKEMQLAYVTCEQYRSGGLHTEWVSEAACMNLTSLTKKDVFVLHEFKGALYDKLVTTKCRIVGARCLSCCLTEGTEIPFGPAVFTVAMRGLEVTASGFTKLKKAEIQQKVHWMGGTYTSELTEDTTHLICDKAMTHKYCVSAAKGLPIMSVTWIEAVWNASLEQNINGSSARFDSHKLPVFAKLHMTTSGISRHEKEKITRIVKENGGICMGSFVSEKTDIVILNRGGLGSDKYKAAMEYNKECILPAWVYLSLEKGYAQDYCKFRVSGASTSSPVAGNKLPDMSLNFSRITNLRPPSNFVDETQPTTDSTISSTGTKMSQQPKKSYELNSAEKDIVMAIENFNMSQVKKSGSLFDGFCIYICGMEGPCRERISACVSRNGGVRYDEPHERVTHVVSGTCAATAQARAALPDVPVLSPMWLLHSISARKVMDEPEYLMGETSLKHVSPASGTIKEISRKANQSIEPSSPMSKRNLQLLRAAGQTVRPPVPKFILDKPPPEEESIMQQYLTAGNDTTLSSKKDETLKSRKGQSPNETAIGNTTGKENETDCTDEPTEEMDQIFEGMRFEMQCLDEPTMLEISSELERAGGQVVSEGSGGEYVIVPLDFDDADATNKDAQVVTVHWLKDCLSQQRVVELEYYHRPVQTPEAEEGSGVLAGVVISISTYTNIERTFLDELAQLLGAITQCRFCRRTTSTTRASTHLLCPEPKGEKYAGALKWGVPAVSAQWLLACAAAARRVKEQPFLIGDTKAPVWTDSIEESIEPPPAGDKENEDVAMRPPSEGVCAPKRPSTASKEETPLKKIQAVEGGEGDMSPASRYIAMARQGLLGADSQQTPKRITEIRNDSFNQEAGIKTPPLEDALATPNLKCFSPTTRRRLQAIKRGEMPSDPIRTPKNPFEMNVKTPDSAFGAALRPGVGRMSPESRKQLWCVVQELPSLPPQTEKAKKDTPLSEVCNRYLSRYNPHGHAAMSRKLDVDDDTGTPPSKVAKVSADQQVPGPSGALSALVDQQLQKLCSVLTSGVALGPSPAQASRLRRSTPASPHPPRPLLDLEQVDAAGVRTCRPDSQNNTVGWDDSAELKHFKSTMLDSVSRPPADSPTPAPAPAPPPRPKRFMMSSNVDNREEICAMVASLGGEVSECSQLDAEATHLLCALPSRSEKVLGSIAAGKWVLHPAYAARSKTQGTFLEEEEFEWGNEKATDIMPSKLSENDKVIAHAAHRWRVERSAGRPGPFRGMRVVLHVPAARQVMLARLLAAGGGQVLSVSPPYACTEATHCFADLKKQPMQQRDLLFFVNNKIPVCPPVILTNYLMDKSPPAAMNNCIPEYKALIK